MKNILATIGVLVCFIIATIPLHAQLTKRIDASDLVVKGEVVEKKVRWSDDNSQIISENKIRISKIFRGSVVDSFITVISLGGSIDDELQYLPHGINLKLYDSGYFVLSKSYHEHGEFTFLDLKFGYYEIYSANDHYRANPYVLFQGTKISTSDFEDKIVTNTRTIPLTFEEYNRLSESVISQESEGESCDFTSSKFPESKIDFRFDNIHFTSNFSHLEFDVIVEVNRPGLKFGKGDIALKYSARDVLSCKIEN